MSVVLARNWGNNFAARRRTAVSGRSFVLKRSRPKTVNLGKAGLNTIIFAVVGTVIFAGAFYLYQVNNIAIQSYEVRDMENKIQDLQNENQKLKIQEVESKSMYNIEKDMENMDLVNSANVSYVEMKGPMAMK